MTDKKSNAGSVYTPLDLKILLAIVRQAAVAIENAQMYKELKYLTITDPLTNLFNYRHFIRSLDHEIKQLKRYSRPLCLSMMDVDDFKLYNDTYGHLEGDYLLKEMGKILKANLREADIVCRYAGDEFVVILPETDVNQAHIVSQKILHALSALDLRKKVAVSIGLAQCAPSMNRLELIQKADQALYEAKKGGKNQAICLK